MTTSATSYAVEDRRSAWAPDGSLAVIHWDSQAAYGTWEVLLVDPATGAPKGTAATTRGRTLIRLIGWSGEQPVVVGYGNGECYPMFTYGDVLDRGPLLGYPAVLLALLGVAVACGLIARRLSRRAAGRGRSSGPAAS